jgi:hypothetical protein
MKTISTTTKASIEFRILLTLTIDEAAALNAIAGYGTDAFLKVFYQEMGKAYLEDYEDDLRTLFDKLQNEIPLEISKIEEARAMINQALKKIT